MSCKQTKYVPEGRYLLKKNKIILSGDKIDESNLEEIIRQQPNYRSFGVKWKLLAYNMVDSARVADKRIQKNQEIRLDNRKRLAKQDRINSKRIDRANRKGKEYYTQKIIPLKDTVQPRKFFREWFKYKLGKPPVVFDSIPYNKSLEQLSAYLRKKGYYYGEVNGLVKYKKNRKAIVTYSVKTGEQYKIDSVYVVGDNRSVTLNFEKFISEQQEHPLIGQPFDSDELDDLRSDVARFMRDEALYGFSASHIRYIADTNKRDMTVTLGVRFQDRLVRDPNNRDSMIAVKHRTTLVRDVFFHVADTFAYDGNFLATMREMGLEPYNGSFLRTIDTLVYAEVKENNSDQLDEKRIAIFTYNGELIVKPSLLEAQNYLEKTNYYKEKYVERSYNRLLQLGLFQAIKTEIVENKGTNTVDVHYYLVPVKQQSFGIEPKATNSNGFLGVSASLNNTHRNLFHGGEKLTISFSGGFESQPPIFDETIDGEPIQSAGRSFNTFEIGPSLKLEVPGLLPVKFTKIPKRHRPKTVVSAAYNYQRRDDFTRGTFQMNYLWQFYVAKTQIFQVGLPGLSVMKFVNIDKRPDFQQAIDNLNDLFLSNAYSNQLIWQDWKFTFEYNIKEKQDKKGNLQLYFNSTFDPAGNVLSMFKNFQDTLANGQHTIFGVGYSQFTRLDNELIISQPVGKEKSFNFRFNAGGGIPYGNTTTSLPYDYSFFAGGANDNRGWRARALGPGSYKYYLDTNRTATQIGDLRLGGSVEYRFAFGSLVKGALFADAGNIWLMQNDINRPGGQISENWYNEIAVAAGMGLRFDFDFFIIRADLGIPLRNPALPNGAQWIFQSREPYYAEGEAVFGTEYEKYLPLPFVPQLHFGIGYPF